MPAKRTHSTFLNSFAVAIYFASNAILSTTTATMTAPKSSTAPTILLIDFISNFVRALCVCASVFMLSFGGLEFIIIIIISIHIGFEYICVCVTRIDKQNNDNSIAQMIQVAWVKSTHAACHAWGFNQMWWNNFSYQIVFAKHPSIMI